MTCALGIFAKTPVAGKVKTRLSPPLSPAQAAEFYRLSLDETLSRVCQGPWQTVLFYSDDADYFRRHYPGLPCHPQRGVDLGARMERALAQLLAGGHEAAMLIGSDSPDLPLALLEEGYRALASHEVVVAPSRDGGYVLIGESRHHPSLFHDIPWSSDAVLGATRAVIARLGIHARELPAWEDVDDAASLERLIRRSPASRCAEWARPLLEGTSG